MNDQNWHPNVAELIGAIGEDWFVRTLQCVLQQCLHYDYFLLVHYRRGESVRALSFDFDTIDSRRAVRWLECETFIVEPIFRLFEAGAVPSGVHDMEDLVERLGMLSPPDIPFSALPHLVEDDAEEIGWRTMGWPRNLQETCMLVPIGADQLLAVSLYNTGLEHSERQLTAMLERACPALAACLVKHADMPAGKRWLYGKRAVPHGNIDDVKVPSVDSELARCFFAQSLGVQITARESAVFAHLLRGATVPAIAATLGMTANTVRTHRRNVYRRLGRGSLPELINGFFRFTNDLEGTRAAKSLR